MMKIQDSLLRNMRNLFASFCFSVYRGSGIMELSDLRSTPVIPSFNWSPVTGLFPLFSGFCLKSLQHFTDFYFDRVRVIRRIFMCMMCMLCV